MRPSLCPRRYQRSKHGTVVAKVSEHVRVEVREVDGVVDGSGR
jgi:hypothetical protein